MMALLRNRSFLILAGAELISALGYWVTTMALFAILVVEGTGGVKHTSALFLAGVGPSMLLGPVAGWLADRVERRRLMVASQLLSGLAVAALIFLERLEWIYLALVLQSVAGSVMGPARRVVIPGLVGRADLSRANAFMQQLTGVIKIAAPMLAGFVLTLMTPHQAVVLDVISYGLAAAALTLLPKLPARPAAASPAEKPAPAESGWTALRRTVSEVSRQAPLLGLVFPPAFMLTMILMAYDITAAVFTRDVLQASAGFMGLSVGLIGAGMGAAALALMLVKQERNLWMDLILGMLLLTAIPLTVALADWIPSPTLGRGLVLAGSLVGGIGLGLTDIQGQTLIQVLAPAGWVGRMGGLFQSLVVGGQITGLLLTPLVVPQPISFGLFFGLGAGVMLLLTTPLVRAAWRARKTASPAVAVGR